MRAKRHACLTEYQNLVPVSGYTITYHLALLCLRCSDNSCSCKPGLADAQGITAVPVLLYCTGWNFK